MSKYKCPKCLSINIGIWEEHVIEKRYKMSKNGKRYKRPYETFYNGAEIHEGLICLDCKNIVNWVNEDLSEWEQECKR